MEAIYENLKGSDTLLVAFQPHSDRVFGTNTEEFRGILGQLNYDILKIYDTNDGFFYDGIDSTYDTMEKFVDFLAGYISGYTKTVFMGNCGGGHSAILFGTMLNVDKVIAFNSVSAMDQQSLLDFEDTRCPNCINLDQSLPFLNLKTFLQDKTYSTQIYNIVAKNIPQHMKHSDNLSTLPNVNIDLIDCPGAVITFYLMRNNLLIPKINEIINS